ncbi:MAG: hypothetical protein FJ098_01230 [Deltaproteobacteria bacterium]|nr:hypothetical protein [Deltaproteobacteria bacterium]
MPRSANFQQDLHTMPLEYRLEGASHQFQKHWYQFLAKELEAAREMGPHVLDVGASDGYGVRILQEAGFASSGIDIAPLHESVKNTDISAIPGGSWDWVLAVDVVEHVANDILFLRHLLRVAKRGAFFSTPNWNVCRGANPHHIREYSPQEIKALILLLCLHHDIRGVQIYTSDGQNDVHERLELPLLFHQMQDVNFGVLLLLE